MNYRLVVTETAKQDLRDIVIWIAEQSKDIGIAKRFAAELKDKIQKLEAFPNKGAIPKDRILMSAGFRYIVHKEYLIFYIVEEEKKIVNIMAIFNAKQDYMRVMYKYI